MSGLTGIDRLLNRMRSLPKQVAGPIAVKTVRAGMVVQHRAIRNRATPFLRQTVGYRMARKQEPFVMRGIVGINVGRQATQSERWAPLMVMGSVQRFRKTRSGALASTGQIIANNIVEQGVAASQGEVTTAMETVLKNEFKRINR